MLFLPLRYFSVVRPRGRFVLRRDDSDLLTRALRWRSIIARRQLRVRAAPACLLESCCIADEAAACRLIHECERHDASSAGWRSSAIRSFIFCA